MKALACLLAAILAGALIWRSCASDDGQAPQPGPAQAQDAPPAKRAATAPSTAEEPRHANEPAPNLPGKMSKVAVNDASRGPGETERQYQDRMDVVGGLEAFRQRAGIGDEQYRKMLVAIYDHQYNWAKFMDANPYEGGPSIEEREELVLDLSGSLQQQVMGWMSIRERLIWYETCPRCMLQIMFGSDMVRLEEGER